jgi:hypothetical protein
VGDQFCEDVICKNNIFDINRPVGTLIFFDEHAADNGCVVENSVVYGAEFKLTDNATTYATLALAQAAGWMADSVDTDPLLANMIPATPITGAEDLGDDYDDGLDVASTFGSATTLPSIVTKQQPATWQMGAYIQ